MNATVTDLFCGAGGSSLGAEAAGAQLVMAANHWQTAIDVHQAHFPNADHDLADVSQADPRRYPKTDILLASPECTNHSQARGVSRRKQDTSLWDAPDPSAERSRATMWDVIRFAEQIKYSAMIVENVVEATKWVLWPAWIKALEDLGYEWRVLSHNSMHHGVAQSRDRIYVACWRKGLRPDLDFTVPAWCTRCETFVTARQGFNPGRTVGRYRQQWRWHCGTCDAVVEPGTPAARSIIDWSLDCPPFGAKARAAKTRARLLAGLQKYGWAPIVTAGAGQTFEATPGIRARSLDDPLPTQHTTATHALAVPDGFLMNTAHQGRTHGLDQPHPTVCATDDRLSLIVPLRRNGVARDTAEPLPTITSGGNHHALVYAYQNGVRGIDPLATLTVRETHGLIVRSTGFVGSGELGRFTTDTDRPLPTCVTSRPDALVMRNYSSRGGQDGGEMVTPIDEPTRTQTGKLNQALVVPVTQADVDRLVDECGFRMLEPHEIAAAMAFPEGYIPDALPKKDRVKLAGNAVTPPVSLWNVGRMIQAIESAA